MKMLKNGTFTSNYNSINRKMNNYKNMVFKCFVARLQNTLHNNRQYKNESFKLDSFTTTRSHSKIHHFIHPNSHSVNIVNSCHSVRR